MRKFTFCISVLFVQGLFSQITVSPFTPNIGHRFFPAALDAFGNEIIATAGQALDPSLSNVFVFEKNGATVNQVTYFAPADMAQQDYFGTSISIDNDFIAAGSSYNDQVATNAGAVYMYRKVAGSWTFFQKITPFDGSVEDNFGTEVKVIGNQLFVSSVNDEPIGAPANTDSGAVYIYNFNGTTWNFLQKLTQSGSSDFGYEMKSSGNNLVIRSSLGLHTYTYDGSNWNFLSTITSPATVDFDLDNGQLFLLQMVGFASSMEIYDLVANNWSLNTTLTSLNYNDKMATNFKVKGDIMFICLNFHALLYTDKTPVALYRKIAGSWTFQEYIYGQGDILRDDAFGARMAISNDIVVMGAQYEHYPFAFGKAYTFDVALGVNENLENDLKVYPNPTSEMLYLSDNLADEISFVAIYQYDGKLIRKIQFGFDSISLRDLHIGVYLFKFTMHNGSSVTRKIVKI